MYGRLYRQTMNRMSRNAINSAMKVAFGSRKFVAARTGCGCAMTSSPLFWSAGDDEDEQHGEGQVDEVHGLHQADGQEEQRLQLTLCLRLPGNALDQRATGQTVTDGSANGTAAEREPATDETAGDLDRSGCSCHVLSPLGWFVLCKEDLTVP